MSDPNRARELLAAECSGVLAEPLRNDRGLDLDSSLVPVRFALRAIERALSMDANAHDMDAPALNGERDAILEECAAELAKVEPDEEAAGGPASWGDFVQVGQGAIRGLKSGDHLGNYILDSRHASG
jgi:hypothetical protein